MKTTTPAPEGATPHNLGGDNSRCPVRALIGETKVIAEERRTRPKRVTAGS